MDGIYSWAGTIVSYLVFVTVLTGLLPTARYEKYLHLFAGCILILLVFQPLAKGLRLEESINSLFRSISFEKEAQEIQRQLDEQLHGMEERRLELLISGYEDEAGKEITRLAEAAGFAVKEAAVTVERDPESPGFAGVRSVRLEFQKAPGEPEAAGEEMGKGETEEGAAGTEAGEKGEAAAAVAEEAGKGEAAAAGTEEGGKSEEAQDTKGSVDAVASVKIEKVMLSEERGRAAVRGSVAAEEHNRIERLKQQIAAYYQVEEAYVEIRMED